VQQALISQFKINFHEINDFKLDTAVHASHAIGADKNTS
jgi:hypothetical protein